MKVFVIEETLIRSFDDDRIDETVSRRYCYGDLAFDMILDAQNFCRSLGCSPVDDGLECAYHFKRDILIGSTCIYAYYDIVELHRILSFE